MEIKNTTTGEIHGLSVYDPKTGLDWTNDLLHNESADMKYNPEIEMYEMDNESIQWWEDIIPIIQENSNQVYYIRSNLDSQDCQEFDNDMWSSIEGYNELLDQQQALSNFLKTYNHEK